VHWKIMLSAAPARRAPCLRDARCHRRRGEALGALAATYTGVLRAHERRERLAPEPPVIWCANAARDAFERRSVDADGRREHRNVARERLEDREAEALALRWHDNGVGSV